MGQKGQSAPRKPATKFPHLRKKMQKNRPPARPLPSKKSGGRRGQR